MKIPKLIDQVVAVDTETSGPDLFQHKLLTVAFIPVDDKSPRRDFAVKYKNPLVWGGRGREFFQQYSKHYEMTAVPPIQFCDDISDYVGSINQGTIYLLGHNVSFDNYFLRKVFFEAGRTFPAKISHRTIDTHSLLFEKCCLKLLDQKYLASDEAISLVSTELTGRHTAAYDAEFALKLFQKLLTI